MRFSLSRGPLLLLLWQAAPVSVQQDSAGRLQLAVGFGGGAFEDRQLSCEGEVLSAEPVPFTVGGAQLDYWLTDGARLSGFGGVISSGGQRGGFGGLQAALEGRGAGIGIGYATIPWQRFGAEVGPGTPSGYLRLGSRDRGHFRIDLFPPTPTPGATGDVFRVGVGFNRGLRHAGRGFVGLSLGPYADESHLVGFFGEVEIPMTSWLDGSLAASWRPSETYQDYGARVGLRYHLAR